MRYLLDSNIVSDFYNVGSQNHGLIYSRMLTLSPDDEVFVSILTLYEMEYGCAKAPETQKSILRKRISEMLEDFAVLPLIPEGAKIFGELKNHVVQIRQIKKENAKKHNLDMMIASIALTQSCIIVSEDSIYREIRKLNQNLKIANWIS